MLRWLWSHSIITITNAIINLIRNNLFSSFILYIGLCPVMFTVVISRFWISLNIHLHYNINLLLLCDTFPSTCFPFCHPLSKYLLIAYCYYLVAKSCPIFCDSMDYSPPGSSVHVFIQTRILEWVAIPFYRGSSQPRDRICISCLGK